MPSTPLPQLKKMVELVLADNPEYAGVQARNSDIALTILIWQRWYNVGNDINVGRLFDLPREDNVKRVRAVFQNVEHKYLPTNPDIMIKRGIEEEYWAEALGYRLTKEEWRRHHRTQAENDRNDKAVTDMLRKGETRLEPFTVAKSDNQHFDVPAPKRVTKMRAIYLPKSYASSSLKQNQEYDVEVEQLATGKPIKMISPIEAVYPNLQSFGRTWKVIG